MANFSKLGLPPEIADALQRNLSKNPLNVRWGPRTEQTWYVRPSGNDDNDGLTPETAVKSPERASELIDPISFGRRQILNITGCDFSDSNIFNFPAPIAGLSFDLDATATGPNNYAFKALFQIRADPTLIQSITVSNVSNDSVTGLATITVNETLTTNAHVGQFVLGAGIFQYGVVAANDTNTLTVASEGTTWTAPVGLYTTGATFTFGDPSNFFNQASYLQAYAETFISGVAFKSTDSSKPAALSIFAQAPINMQQCTIEGLSVDAGSGSVTLDSCYIHDKNLAQFGGPLTVRSSLLKGITFNMHGIGGSGVNEWSGDWIEDSTNAFGAGNFESECSFQLKGVEIVNSATNGIEHLSGTRASIKDSRIRGSTSDGVVTKGNGVLLLDNVVGTGNGGYGARIEDGAQIIRANSSSVTGTSGDVFLGGAGTTAWAGGSVDDGGAINPQFVRFYNT